jgi:hypothetical protein
MHNHHTESWLWALLIRSAACYRLQILLWQIWTMVVIGTAAASWASAPSDLPGFMLHCLIAGLLGMIVMTKIEMHLQPWRFEEQKNERIL